MGSNDNLWTTVDTTDQHDMASDAGGAWNTTKCNISAQTDDGAAAIFEDICIVDPDGSLDRCGGHFPCAASLVMSIDGHVVVGFNGEG